MDPGDRLVPSLIRERLSTSLIGRRIYYYPEVDSTNRAALDLARNGEPEGTLVVTDFQTKGRGRLDHNWTSPEGKNLLFSLILRPEGEPGFLLPSTLALSVGISETLSKMFDIDAGVKWPNDLVTPEGKIGGILAERLAAAGGSAAIVVGIGLNVNSREEDFPAEYRESAASCRTLTGKESDRVDVLAAVLESIENSYTRFLNEGFAAFRRSYEDRLFINGWRVWFDHEGRRLAGTVEGVQDDGALLVRLGADDEPLALYNETVSVEK